mgnify:CR=1 FL=1
MYIFLDESYNLKDRYKPQLISINGFMTVPVKKVWKQWREYRRKFAGRWRIHATDAVFEPLREKVLHLMQLSPDITLVSVLQMIPDIPAGNESPYYRKGKLHFDKVYEDMLKSLFNRLQLGAYTSVTITVDSRKVKYGALGKKRTQEHILAYLTEYYPTTRITFRIAPSTSDVLLEVADFVSNTFYKHYTGQEIPALQQLEGKTIALKNPLK